MQDRTVSLTITAEENAYFGMHSEKEQRTKMPIAQEKQRTSAHCIELSSTQFQALQEDMNTPPSEAVQERRRHLMRYELWK